jgi:hypothetical protein
VVNAFTPQNAIQWHVPSCKPVGGTYHRLSVGWQVPVRANDSEHVASLTKLQAEHALGSPEASILDQIAGLCTNIFRGIGRYD